MKNKSFTSRQIINICKQFYKAKGRLPTIEDLKSNGVTREVIRQYFGTKTVLCDLAQEELATQLLKAPNTKTVKLLGKRQKRYIIIGIQNNTKIDKKVMRCLEVYAKYNKADILAMPMYYRNPTAVNETNKLDKEYWWSEEFNGKYVSKNLNLGKNLFLASEHRVPATSLNPLGGLEGLASGKSMIVGNAGMQMKVVPNSQDKLPAIMHTTGTVCQIKNYSKTNAGGKAKKLATAGAILVELSGDIFHLRQLEYKNNCICDLGKVYTTKDVKDLSTCGESAMIWGDIHAEVVDPVVVNKSLKVASVCNVKTHYLHDLLDFACQSHHNKNNFIMRHALNKHHKDKVVGAIQACSEFIALLSPANIKIVDSNHHDHLTRWINERDFKGMESDNAYFYICLVKHILESVKLNLDTQVLTEDNAFKIALEMLNKGELVNVEFLTRNESHSYKGIELSQHGDVGTNGSRGSLVGLSRTCAPMVIGHSHTPGINKNVYQVGKTAYLNQSYMKGLSSHLNTHCVIYPNGSRQLITIIGGNFTLS